MFSKIVVENFTTFNNFEFDLVENKTDKKAKKLAIIYGENGIGKTCFIKSIAFLARTYRALIEIESARSFFSQMFTKEETNDESFIRFYNSSLDEYRISGFLSNYRKLNCEDNMKLQYELLINKTKYVYSMVFDKKSIIQEKLICNGLLVFSCVNKKVEFGEEGFTFDSNISDMLRNAFNMYFGEKHTFLACIKSSQKSVSSSYFKHAVPKQLLSFLSFLDSIYVNHKQDSRLLIREPERISAEFVYPLVQGHYSERMKKKLDKTSLALTMFYSSLYSNIESLSYKIETTGDGNSQYHLFFNERTNSGAASIPFEFESTGTTKLASLFIAFYEVVKNKKIVVYDEIDNGINDMLLKTIFDSLDTCIGGQLIVTTHNTLLLKNSIKKNIYLLDRNDDLSVCSYSLDEFGRKIQSGTDVVGQYLKGLYGGVPQSGAFSMEYILEALKDYE